MFFKFNKYNSFKYIYLLAQRNFGFFVLMCFILFLPNLNNFVRIYFISDTLQINILSQLQWLQILLETIKAFLITPVFYWLHKSLTQNKTSELFTYTTLCLFFSFIFISFFIVEFAKIANFNIQGYYLFLILECLNYCLYIIFSFLIALLLVREQKRILVIVVLLKFFITFLIDFFILKNNFFEMSVYSVNSSNLISNIFCIYFCIILLKKHQIYLRFKTIKFSMFSLFSKINIVPALEQFMNNLSYFLIILSTLNLIQQNTYYYIVMNYFWGYFLIPILAFGEIIKKILVDNSNFNIQYKLFFIISVNLLFCFFALISFFLLSYLSDTINVESLEIIKKLYPSYVVFFFSFSISSIFYALGYFYKNFLISIVVNFFVYLPAYFYNERNMDFIILVFSCAMYLNFFISIILFIILIKTLVLQKRRIA